MKEIITSIILIVILMFFIRILVEIWEKIEKIKANKLKEGNYCYIYKDEEMIKCKIIKIYTTYLFNNHYTKATVYNKERDGIYDVGITELYNINLVEEG